MIAAKICSMYELKEVYSLDEALKLYAVYRMQIDVQNGRIKDMEQEENRHDFA